NVVRGPRQTVDIAGRGGIPLSIDNAEGVTEFSVALNYDAAKLNISGAVAGADLPPGWTAQADLSTPGVAVISGSGPALPAGPADLAILEAAMLDVGAESFATPLVLSDALLNAGSLPVDVLTRALVVSYFGDASGDGTYSALDASFIARAAVGIDQRFQNFPTIDPILIGDITGDGTLSALDASYVARKAVGLEQTQIPNLPAPLPPPPVESLPGIDARPTPLYFITISRGEPAAGLKQELWASGRRLMSFETRSSQTAAMADSYFRNTAAPSQRESRAPEITTRLAAAEMLSVQRAAAAHNVNFSRAVDALCADLANTVDGESSEQANDTRAGAFDAGDSL
ncbi:MAG: hypothetical protein KDA42_19400, partial [Planctomycetales bacterium]|nr:hypothetical protein [Planctomycetales bacterium]